jgi:hypothetical protein
MSGNRLNTLFSANCAFGKSLDDQVRQSGARKHASMMKQVTVSFCRPDRPDVSKFAENPSISCTTKEAVVIQL